MCVCVCVRVCVHRPFGSNDIWGSVCCFVEGYLLKTGSRIRKTQLLLGRLLLRLASVPNPKLSFPKLPRAGWGARWSFLKVVTLLSRPIPAYPGLSRGNLATPARGRNPGRWQPLVGHNRQPSVWTVRTNHHGLYGRSVRIVRTYRPYGPSMKPRGCDRGFLGEQS